MKVSVVIVLPTGVRNNMDNFKVQVSNCCRRLVVSMEWPPEVTDTMKLHKWMGKDLVSYHPRLLAYEECLRTRREKISETVCSVASINLPCKVLRSLDMNKRFTFMESTTQLMYVDLEADKRSDYRDEDSNEVIVL